jgi:hypothetical protein
MQINKIEQTALKTTQRKKSRLPSNVSGRRAKKKQTF